MCKSNQKKSFTNLIEVMMHLSSDTTCREYLEQMRWGGNIVCPHCENNEKIYTMKKNYKCAKCRKQFSVTKGSIFENSAIPLQKWFAGIWLITSHKNDHYNFFYYQYISENCNFLSFVLACRL